MSGDRQRGDELDAEIAELRAAKRQIRRFQTLLDVFMVLALLTVSVALAVKGMR